MEFVVVLIVVIVVLKILGVSNFMLVAGGMALVELAIVFMVGFFMFSLVLLLLSKPRTAQFSKIDHARKSKFKVAYYNVEGTDYPCIFPSEMILNDQMYKKGRSYRVMYNARMGKVFDIWTILTIILGLICSGGALAGTVWMIFYYLI